MITLRRNPRETDKWIDDLVGSLTDPLIVMPGGWGEDVPKWIKDQLPIDRMIENMKAAKENRQPTATDLEAMWYISSTSLIQPLDGDWSEIYMNLFHRVMEKQNKEIPGDLPDPQLSLHQKNMLADLKRWIYERREKARKGERRSQTVEDRIKIQERLARQSRSAPAAAGKPIPQKTTRRDRREIERQERKKEEPAFFRDKVLPGKIPPKPWVPSGIEIWQLPKEQYISLQMSRYFPGESPSTHAAEVNYWKNEHQKSVAAAILKNKPVLKDVMKDYKNPLSHNEKQPWQMTQREWNETIVDPDYVREPWKLTENQFHSRYGQHIDIRAKAPEEAEEHLQSIKQEGFRSSYLNTFSPTRTGVQHTYTPWEKQHMTKAGKKVYAVPEKYIKSDRYIKSGWRPFDDEVVDIEYDGQPLHEAIVKKALKAGKPVPPEVLKDYPELKVNDYSGIYYRTLLKPSDDKKVVFYSKRRDYAEELQRLRGKGDIIKKELKLNNILIVEADTNKFSDRTFEKAHIYKAMQDGKDAVVFVDKENDDVFVALIAKKNPTLMIPVKSKTQLRHLYHAQQSLRKAGVSFDSGTSIIKGKPTSRDWELDWSLKGAKLKKNLPNPSRRVRYNRGDLQETLNAAAKLLSDHPLYIYATYLGFTIEKRDPGAGQSFYKMIRGTVGIELYFYQNVKEKPVRITIKNPQMEFDTSAMEDRIVDKAMALSRGDVAGTVKWLVSMGAKVTQQDEKSANLTGLTGITVGIIPGDPNNCAVILGFATLGTYWATICPHLLNKVNKRWKEEGGAGLAVARRPKS